MTNLPILAEYIWVDGTEPTRELRSKTRIMPVGSVPPSVAGKAEGIEIERFPIWGADGSSTNQAEGSDSDIELRPVRAVPDPFHEGGYLVMCEVFTAEGKPHASNKRAWLREVLDKGAGKEDPMFGFEQEYTFFDSLGKPLGFPANGFPPPQGPYYCGVGVDKIAGRPVYEAFTMACLNAGIPVTGTNWEVMPGQAEVQVAARALEATDGIWLSRWLLARVGEDHGVAVNFDPKPAKGDWNGAGMHTNFSTQAMREDGGFEVIKKACEAIGKNIEAHLAVYGNGYQDRLTGHHETCAFNEFRWGVADRTASIRVPRHVNETGKGYLEDRRPNANADPYEVAAQILETVCG